MSDISTMADLLYQTCSGSSLDDLARVTRGDWSELTEPFFGRFPDASYDDWCVAVSVAAELVVADAAFAEGARS